MYYKFEIFFRKGLIDKLYWKVKFYIFMLFRMCKKIELLLFNSKKIDNYCEDLLNF